MWLVMGMHWLDRGTREGRTTDFWRAGAATGLLALLHPYSQPLVLACAVVLPVARRGRQAAGLLARYFLAAGPFLIYLALMTIFDPLVSRHNAQGEMKSPALASFVYGFGLPLLLTGAGLVLGLVCGAIFSMVRSKKQWSQRRIGGFAAAGMALGLTIAFLIPNEYVSTAVLRTADGDKLQSTMAQVLSDDSLAAIVRDQRLFERERSRSSMGEVARRMRNEHVHVRTGRLSPSGWAVYISFTYPDRGKAQGVTRDLVSRFIATTGAMPSDTGVLETANLPATPNYPNRLNITLLGTVVGILLGLAASRFRRPKLAAA